MVSMRIKRECFVSTFLDAGGAKTLQGIELRVEGQLGE
jgi:hypothetical protein